MKETDLKDYDITKDSCADCSSADLFIKLKLHPFHFGVGKQKINMEVEIPVIVCRGCGAEWMNYIAEDILEEAVAPLREVIYGDKKE